MISIIRKIFSRRTIILVLFLFASFIVYSQNFIRNGDFENHSAIKGRSFGNWLPTWFNNKVDGWFSYDSEAVLCDCGYTFSRYEKEKGIPIRNCLKEAFNKDNCSYVELLFYSHVTDDLSKFYSPGIAATYMFQKLDEPLDYGEVYEVSYDIFIPKKFNDKANQLKNHCGFYLSNKVLEKEVMIKSPVIPIDTFVYNEWTNVKKYVRPLCDINYITFGVFRGENWPNYYSDRTLIYFVDNVTAKKCKKSELDKNIKNIPCFIQDMYILDSMNTVIYFDCNKDAFNSIDTTQISQIVNKAKKEKLMINITGHTDNTGSENLDLSNRRALNVENFIFKNYKINASQINIIAVADSFPVLPNSNKKNRAKNRRVVVELTGNTVAQKMYAEIIRKIKNSDFNVFKDIKKWLYFSKFKKHLVLLLDPRLKVLHKLPLWNKVRSTIKREYRKYSKKDLAFVLDSLTGEDQRYRTLYYSMKYLTPDNDLQLRKELSLYYDIISDTIISLHDAENRKRILPLIREYGWPKISEVGIRAAKSAFYVIDHSGRLEFFLEYLPILKKLCIEGEADWSNYANMYDRSLKIQGLPQEYGTQYIIEGNNINYYKHINFDKMNEKRTKIGLYPISKEIGFTLK